MRRPGTRRYNCAEAGRHWLCQARKAKLMSVCQDREPSFSHQVSRLSPPVLARPRILRPFTAALLAVAVTAGAAVAGAAPALAAAPPAVTSFSPASGTIGTHVIIVGSGFTGATAVKFNTAASHFTVNSSTKITATVPASASAGTIKVTTAAGTGSSTAKFTVDPGIILSATSGHPDGTVTVSGAGFKPFEAVDLYFDTSDLAGTNGTGNSFDLAGGTPAAARPQARILHPDHTLRPQPSTRPRPA